MRRNLLLSLIRPITALTLCIALLAVGGAALLNDRHNPPHSPEAIEACLRRVPIVGRSVSMIREGDNAVLFVQLVGWHATWMVAADISGEPIVAYDTFREDDPFSHALFRRPVNWVEIVALKMCGINYAGALPSSVETWVLTTEGYSGREPHDFPPVPLFYEVNDIEAILPPS